MGCPMIGKIITADSNVKIVVFNLKMTSTRSSIVSTGVLHWTPASVSLEKVHAGFCSVFLECWNKIELLKWN